jgi:sugar phosphate permease
VQGGPHERIWLVGKNGTPDILIARTQREAGRALAKEFGATAALVYIFVRNSPAERGLPSLAAIDGLPQPPVTNQSVPLGQGILVVLREPNTWLLGGYAFLLFGTMTMMQGLWAVPYLMDAYGQTQQQAAAALTLWAVGLIVGCTLWRYMADKVVGSRKAMVLTGAIVYGLLWVLLSIWPVGLTAGML